MDIRDAFVKWRREQSTALVAAGQVHAAKGFDEMASIQLAVWEAAWQASREAVVVELPEAYATDADGCWMLPRKSVRSAIEAQGLKVKP